MVLLQRKLYFFKDPEGSNIFHGGGGGATFFRGSKCLFLEKSI